MDEVATLSFDGARTNNSRMWQGSAHLLSLVEHKRAISSCNTRDGQRLASTALCKFRMTHTTINHQGEARDAQHTSPASKSTNTKIVLYNYLFEATMPPSFAINTNNTYGYEQQSTQGMDLL